MHFKKMFICNSSYLVSVFLMNFAECFRRRDTTQQGFVNFHYDDVSKF